MNRSRLTDEDLIGAEPALHIPRRVGRPSKDDPEAPSNQPGYKLQKLVEAKRKKMARENSQYSPSTDDDAADADDTDLSVDIGVVLSGVSATWLGRAFQLPRAIVEKKVRKVRPVAVGKTGNPLYALKDVAGLLVEVEFDLEAYLKDVKDEDLPEELRLKFWQAKRARQKFEQDDGHLWRTETVMAKFGELLLELREKVNQLPDKVSRLTSVNSEQYRLFRAGGDEIMDDLFEAAQKFARQDRTLFGMDPREEPEDDLI